jgi:hypothetical protein
LLQDRGAPCLGDALARLSLSAKFQGPDADVGLHTEMEHEPLLDAASPQ